LLYVRLILANQIRILMKKILIITNSDDLHADLLIPLLVKKEHTPFRINLDHFPRDYQITQQFYQGKLTGEILHIPSAEHINIENVGAIWMRKSASFSYLSEDLSTQEVAFAKAETDHALFGFIYSIDCFWMSHPIAMRGSMWKTEQLQRAVKMGFTIPDSLVTNTPDNVHNFNAHVKGDLIFKAMSSPALAADEVDEVDKISGGLATTLVTSEMLDGLDAVAELPCHFQAYIAKQYELRITIIADQIFAARINSQEDTRTSVDCRDMSAEITYKAIELPEAFKQSCRDFISSYNLNYSALDFIFRKQSKRTIPIRRAVNPRV